MPEGGGVAEDAEFSAVVWMESASSDMHCTGQSRSNNKKKRIGRLRCMLEQLMSESKNSLFGARV